MTDVTVVGAGLAGSEAAWQLARRNIKVALYDMRPRKMTPVHISGDFAELVCSNSLRADSIANAAGLLKEELRRHDSLVMASADTHRLPAGGALAVDRVGFQTYITEKLCSHPNVTVIKEEMTEIPQEGIVIIATGPLTSDALFNSIARDTETDSLYFYDAAAPIVTLESVDMKYAFWQSRYDKGEGADYLNCPMSEEEYQAFYNALMNAEWVKTEAHDQDVFFEGCMPLETMAVRGYDTLRFGPLKPVGLIDPKTGEVPYAVLQLRYDDAAKQLMNLVGCQTRMKWGEQAKVFSHIPALRNAEIVRYGVMHRNTFINSPRLLLATGQRKNRPSLFYAGQITGVEGYIESAAGGCIAGINAARLSLEKEPLKWPDTTMMGALMHHISSAHPESFQPMNVNFGLLPSLERKIRNKKERGTAYANRSLEALAAFLELNHLD